MLVFHSSCGKVGKYQFMNLQLSVILKNGSLM
jgi:hypothetical protein